MVAILALVLTVYRSMLINDYPLVKRREKRQLLVENKLTFEGPESELSIYDTYRAASRIGLDAPQLMYCGMIKGKKIMHQGYQNDDQGQVFLPHESFIMPPGDSVDIDFPEASEQRPTTCLTIEIPQERIETLSERMRDLTTMGQIEHDWQYQPHIIHSHHTTDTQQLLKKLVALFTQNLPDKELMIDLGISELIIKLLRQQGRDLLLNYCRQQPDMNGVVAAIHYLEQNITAPLEIEVLGRLACMSRSRLYVEFKKQLGCTPGEYQQQIRLKLAAKAITAGKTITAACYDTGFNDLSHFSRRFSQFYGCTPTAYQHQQGKQIQTTYW